MFNPPKTRPIVSGERVWARVNIMEVQHTIRLK